MSERLTEQQFKDYVEREADDMLVLRDRVAKLESALNVERETCAKIAESFMDGSSHATLVAGTIAAAIRARTP